MVLPNMNCCVVIVGSMDTFVRWGIAWLLHGNREQTARCGDDSRMERGGELYDVALDETLGEFIDRRPLRSGVAAVDRRHALERRSVNALRRHPPAPLSAQNGRGFCESFP